MPEQLQPTDGTRRQAVPTKAARATMALAVVFVAYNVALAVASGSASASEGAGGAGAEAYYLLVGARVVVQVAIWVAGSVWLGRSYDLAREISPKYPIYRTRMWVWISWVAPIWQFWVPYQVVRDVRRATIAKPIGWLWLWWICWLGSMVADFATATVLGDHPEWRWVALYSTISAVCTAGAGALWVVYVRELTRAQRKAI